jgi:hypothetical protein
MRFPPGVTRRSIKDVSFARDGEKRPGFPGRFFIDALPERQDAAHSSGKIDPGQCCSGRWVHCVAIGSNEVGDMFRTAEIPLYFRGAFAGALMLFGLAVAWSPPAAAVPSYARQTGQACAGCHVGAFGPQLTAFGREFKLRGYTMKAGDIKSLPLSAMMVASYSHTAKDQSADAGPNDGPNNNASLQQLSLFVAGRLGDHVGMFSQVTYSDIDKHVAMDNYDIRYANTFTSGKHAGVYGISLNNNPGLSDLRHSQGAWRFPFIGSELAPAPAAAVFSDGGLEQQVIGADAYVSIDSKWYASFGLYRTMSPAFLARINVDYGGRIVGAAPYWRLSWQPGWGGGGLALGLSGLQARIAPDSSSSAVNSYNDFGVDAEYEKYVGDGDMLTFTGNFTHEHQRLDAAFDNGEADRIGHTLNSANLSASYYLNNTYGFTFGWFDISGTHDSLLYAPEPDSGSFNNSPASRGEILQTDWTPFGKADSYKQPWVNLRIGVQYTHYNKFNGGDANYDGNGRSAGDNDTLFLFIWTAI